jgi:hypothetical protein
VKNAITTLAAAALIGGISAAGHAQDKLNAASDTPPTGVHKEMPLAGSAAAQQAESPGQINGVVKAGSDAAVKPHATTQSKSWNKNN